MSLAHYGDTAFVKDAVTGEIKPAAGATITVYQWGTTVPVSLLQSDGSLLANPFTADPQTGRYDFWTSVGQRVTVQIALTGYTAQQITAEVEPDPALGGTGAHTHPESDIVNLGTDLAAKAPLTGPDFPTYADYTDQAGNPANPAGGTHRLFAKAGGLYAVDPVGSVLGPLGAAGPPSGAASGDLTGNYPGPTLANKNGASGPLVLDANKQVLSANFGAQNFVRTFSSFGGLVGGSATVQANAVGAAEAWLQGGPGRKVIIDGQYDNFPSFDVPLGSVVEGNFYHGTGVKAVANLNADIFTFHRSTGASDPNGKYCRIQGLKIDGNKANQTSGRGIVSNPTAFVSGFDPTADSQNCVRDCWIINCKSDGIASTGDAANLIDHCRVDANDGNGVTTGFDTAIVNCNVGGSGLAGVCWGGTAGPGSFAGGDINVLSTGTWSYLSGQVTASNGYGWIINGNTNNGAHLSSCGAQDNKAIGFELVGNSFVTMASCVADTNSTSSAGTYPGLDMWGGKDNIIELICQDRNAVNTQTHAIQIQNTSTGNTIDVRHRGVAGSTVSTPIQAFAANSVGNSVNVNQYGWGGQGQQAPAFAASFTPDPTAGGTIILGTMTAALTINAVAAGNQWPGQRLRFHLTQDPTGGRTITWNAQYHLAGGTALPTTLSKRNIIEFEWDATLAAYVEAFRSVGI